MDRKFAEFFSTVNSFTDIPNIANLKPVVIFLQIFNNCQMALRFSDVLLLYCSTKMEGISKTSDEGSSFY